MVQFIQKQGQMNSELSPKMKFRTILLIFFVLGLGLRVIFIFGKPQIPVMWDARIYTSAALGIIEYLNGSDGFGHPERIPPDDSLAQKTKFEFSIAENIGGEQIEWLYYSKPTIPQAQEYIFISGPIYPILLAAVLWQNIIPDFDLGRFINALIDSLSVVLLMLIAFRLFGRREAIVAGAIYILYLPFILQCGMISPDPLTICLVLLTLLMILRYYETEKRNFLFLAGAVLAILLLTRPTAALLFAPFLAGLIYDNRERLKEITRPIFLSAVIFIIIILPWAIFASLYYERPAIRDPQYSEANLRSSSLARYEGYDLDRAETDFWSYDISTKITQDLPAYGLLMIKKFMRLWDQPFNDFQQRFIFPGWGEKLYHFLIIIPGLFGIFLFIIEKKKGLIYLALIPAYYTLVHIFFHSLARYNLAAMPFLIIAAGAIGIKGYDYFRGLFEDKRNILLIVQWSLFFCGLIFLFIMPDRFLVYMSGSPLGAWLSVVIRLLLLGLLLFFLIRQMENNYSQRQIIKMLFVPALVLLIILTAKNLIPENWAEWKCSLDSKATVAGVRIYVPKDFRLEPGEAARIGMDLTGIRDGSNRLLISVNQQIGGYTIGQPPLSTFYYNKMTYKVYERLIGFVPEEMRVWSYIPISPDKFNELADRDGYISVTLASADATGDGRNAINLFGNMLVGERDSLLIPDLTHSSIERYVERGDPRPWVKYPLSSDSAISYLIPDVTGNLVLFDNLSPSWGQQTGRYRIIIEVKKKDGTRYYL
jgi:4-amino-4-deoxy-L-arabinose transferase-like glycosyltransferase